MRAQVMAGLLPFSLNSTYAVMNKVLSGVRPDRPMDAVSIGLSDDLWDIVEDGWKQQCAERPTIHAALTRMNRITQHWAPPSPVAVGLQLQGEYGRSSGSTTFSASGRLYSPEFTQQHLSFISRVGASECAWIPWRLVSCYCLSRLMLMISCPRPSSSYCRPIDCLGGW